MRITKIILTVAVFTAFTTACSGKDGNGVSAQADSLQATTVQGQRTDTVKVTEMTKEMFKDKVMDYESNPQEWKYKGTRPAVIDFYATWCGPCKLTAPVVEKVAKEYDGKIDFYKVDVDQQKELAALFGVQSIPTLLFIPMEGQPTKSVGAVDYNQLRGAILTVFSE